MPNFTYDGFLTAASNAGLLGEFSQADLDTARKYPEFGYSILGLKQDIHKATTPEAKLLANEAANQLRSSYGGYTGGKYGADYISDGKIPNQIDSVLDKINGFGSFTFDQERPSYENQYAEQQQALLDAIINRPDFSWTKEDDPQWQQLPARATCGRATGPPQTHWARRRRPAADGPPRRLVTAATQAGDYYADPAERHHPHAVPAGIRPLPERVQHEPAGPERGQHAGAAGLCQVPGSAGTVQHGPELCLQPVSLRLRYSAESAGLPPGAGQRRLQPLDGQGGAVRAKAGGGNGPGPGPGGCHSGRRRKPQRGSGGRLRIRERVCPGPGGSLPAAGCPAGSRRRRSVAAVPEAGSPR